MVRALLIIIGLFAIAVGFEWLKDTPGELALTFGGNVYSVGLAQAALAVLVVAIVAIVIYLILHALWLAPGRALFAWRDRRIAHGRAAITHGLLAIAAGDLKRAELASKEASKRVPDAPLTALLQAQTAQLKGDRESAGKTFTAMLDTPETRIAGLHGLFIEAERQGAAEAAHHYARTAYDARPDTAWAVRALLRYQAAAGDWDAALSTLAGAADNRVIDKKLVRDHRAVLLTAKAMAGEDADTATARQAALEAHQLAPNLAPAAIVAGRILSRAGEVKRAAKVLETTWKARPHPEIADAYAHVRSGDSALDRMGRMENLMRLKPHDDEGRLAFASAAIEATEFQAAREALKPVITTRPTRNALILMAELDEAEHGDRGRVREWLDRAVRAPRDPVWTADGIILDEWAPVSPVTGRIGAVEWKLPVDEGENRLAIDMDDEAFRPRELVPLAVAPAVAAGPVEVPDDVPQDAGIVDITPESDTGAGEQDMVKSTGEVSPEESPSPGGDDGRSGPEKSTGNGSDAAMDADAAEDSSELVEDVPAEETVPEEQDEPAIEAVRDAGNENAQEPEDAASPEATADDQAEGEEAESETEDEAIIPHVPDDPGVDETEEPEPRGFRLF